ncbi:hypothetical protein [Polyangium sp. y55x31]|uniref:hypothetical protein n=1 Tax=Polyangium sp. y55x31 TaxID=3042688 RepID=UPI00248310CA|nr:hypothetical protein [Polyangium sp. y55x31]MDI1480408.1 hypothetical protein [Polyangium sp. y55x31]
MDITVIEHSRSWRSASYSTWNEWLFEYTFSRHRSSEPVEYIPASLEDLCVIVGERPAQAHNVLSAFSSSIVEELQKESSNFATYCLKYRLRSRRYAEYWSVSSYEDPYFFGCLWLTCLVASGYPVHEGNFSARMALVLGVPVNLSKSESGSLDDVWKDLAEWTRYHCTKYRELRLPPRDEYRTNIGRSFYLAFPNLRDRQRMRALLARTDLLGSEPPISLVIEVLLRAKSDFGTDFQQELSTFVDQFLKNGRDPRDSAFWRAVRQEVLSPRPEPGTKLEGVGRAILMAGFDQDELLEPYVACTEEYPTKIGFRREPLDFAVPPLRHRLEPECADFRRSAFESLLTGASRRAYGQGVVPLLEVATGEYRLAQGEEVAGCVLALVREDRVDAFVRAFGGKPRESALDGWKEVAPCQLHQLDTLPEGLEGVTSLLPTTEPQRPVLVGGLRTSTGAFYLVPGYMPCIRAPEAEKVELRVGDTWVACVRAAVGEESVREWLIPESQELGALDEMLVAATWRIRIDSHSLERRGETIAPLARWSIGIGYRGLPSGHFWLETTSRRLQEIRGPLDEIPLGITTTERSRAMDMLFFDASARWLGPGVGEMSLVPRQGFQWLAVGPKKAPSAVVFVGDVTQPVLPDGGTAPTSKDRRHWKHAFSGGRATFVRKGVDYVPLSASPEAQAIHSAYVLAAIRTKGAGTGRTCESTNLDSVIDDDEREAGNYSETSRVLVDALSVIAQHRSGVPLREIHEHLARLTGTGEQHSLRFHLVRALAEAGAVDLLLRTDGRQTLVVVRKPRLVVYRIGHRYRATVMGLLPPTNAELLASEAKRLHVEVRFRNPPNSFQPPVLQLEASDGGLEPLEAVSGAQAFAPPEFLDWPDTSLDPEHFAMRDRLSASPPPEMYEREATWCWKAGAFLRTPEDPGDVSIELRKHERRAPVYVVVQDGAACGWSHSRAWALLDAAERRGRAPFVLDAEGVLRTPPNSLMHLPLPLARLCTVVGGVPGPRVEGGGSDLQITAYQYPFGKRLIPLVARAVPASWTRRKVD